MRKNLRIYLLIFLSICIRLLNGQDSIQKLTFSGYLSSLQNARFQKIDDFWTTSNLLHNRLNFSYLCNENFSASLEIRNRLNFGDEITANPLAASNFDYDNGFLDLSKNIASGKSYVLNSSIDRAWFSFENGKLKATLGRQRINWGQTFVWNPNDIFNAYSFFDFDYIERPGSDAMRVQYFNSEVSSTEIAVKRDRNKKTTAAALYRFNLFSYDFQVLAGVLASNDYVAGFGWSGAIERLSVRGEASYFYQRIKNFYNQKSVFLMSVSLDYTFSNSLTLLGEYLFSTHSIPDNISFLEFYNAPQNVKTISFVKHSIMGQASYPITPLINISASGMYFPGIKGYYVGPSVSYNVAENIDCSAFYQGFRAEINNTMQKFNFLFLRIKWSF